MNGERGERGDAMYAAPRSELNHTISLSRLRPLTPVACGHGFGEGLGMCQKAQWTEAVLLEVYCVGGGGRGGNVR